MATGKHYGSFAKGFMDSLLAVYKLSMTRDLYAARENYYNRKGYGKPGTGLNDPALAGAIKGGHDSAFDGGGGGGGDGGGAYKGGAQAEAHAQEMSQYLQKNYGLTPAGAAGVVGNAWQESSFASNFKPGGDSGSASGMFQWRGDRQTDAKNWMAQNGKDPNAWQSHLDYAMHETQRDYPSMYNQLRTTNDPQYATHEFFHVFERGDPSKANFANRDGMAQAALGGKPATTQVASTSKAAAPTKSTNKGKTPAQTETTPAAAPAKPTPAPDTVASRDGSYQVAGDTDIALTPEQAAKARADLEAHRAAPSDTRSLDDPTKQRPETTGGVDTQSASDPVAVPQEDSSAFGPKSDATPLMPPYPQSTSYPQLHTPVPPPQQGPPQRTGAPPNVGITPSAIPDRPVMGPDQRTGAPPNVGITPSSVGDTSLNAAPMMPPRTTTPSTAYDPKTVQGPHQPGDTGARPDLTARSPASSANVPSKDAQPVSSPAIPSNPTGNTGDAAGTVRYEVPNSSASRAPIITVGDLSHLWGPNPPISQQPTVSSAPPPPRPQDQDFAVGAPNMDDEALGAQIMGSAKGGPIRRYAQGGAIPTHPTMRYADAGAVHGGGALQPGQWDDASGLPAGQPAPFIHATDPSGMPYGQTSLGRGVIGYNWQPTPAPPAPAAAAPAPVPAPAPAPIAPAPIAPPVTPPTSQTIVAPTATTTVTDPTSTTVTGAPGLPNSIQAKSYDPNVDATTGAGFANTSNAGGTDYTVGAGGKLKQNSQGQISGVDQNTTTILSRKGGSITQRVKYDDGGGVSPSAIGGMPPGLGGQQPVPPIYFNPATYAGAGAPVGRGISQNSATTMSAGAIPSLPMARGGVVAFDDGGGVDDTELTLASLDRQDAMDDAAQPAAPATPATTYNSAGEPTSEVNPADYMPSAAPSTPATGGADNIPPPDPTTPQIHDDAGNPSKGLIAAIGDGLHWLGAHLGIGQAQAGEVTPAIAGHPQTQTNRANFASGKNVGDMTPANYEELNNLADPGGQLKEGYRNLAGLEAGYKWALSKGDSATAGKLAAAYLHYSVNLSQNLSGEAQKALYAGDLQKSVDYTNQALQAVPDGRNIHVELSPDGSTVKVTGSSLTGQQLWQKYGAAPELLERASALGKSGKLQWDALESQAAKYDSTFAGMQKNRVANGIAQGKEEAANTESEREAEAFRKMYPTAATAPSAPAAAPTPALPGPGSAPGTTITAANAPPAAPTSPTTGAQPSPNAAGAAQPNAAPQTADENQGQGPTVANAAKGAGLPSQPDQANLPTADAQNADLEHPEIEAQNRVAIRQNIVSQFRDPNTGAWTPQIAQSAPPIPVHPSQIPEYATANPAGKRAIETQYIDGRKQYDAWQKSVTDEMNRQATAADKNYTDDLVSRRAAAATTHSDTAADTRSQRQIDAAALLEKNRREDAENKQQETWTHEAQKPLAPDEVGKRFAEHQPTSYLASSPATAVYKSDGSLDENASTQALGKMFDLNDRGGLRRVDTLSTALTNAQTFNPHLMPQQLGTTLTNMANGSYGYRAKTQPVDYGYGPMRQVEVFRGKVGEGTPTRLLIPAGDYDAVDGIKGEFVAAHKPPPTAPTANAPAAPPTRALPGPTGPDFWSGGRSQAGPGPALKLPEWVPPEQIPPEQRQLYPELNQ